MSSWVNDPRQRAQGRLATTPTYIGSGANVSIDARARSDAAMARLAANAAAHAAQLQAAREMREAQKCAEQEEDAYLRMYEMLCDALVELLKGRKLRKEGINPLADRVDAMLQDVITKQMEWIVMRGRDGCGMAQPRRR